MIFPHFIHSLSVLGLLYFAIAGGVTMPIRLLAVTILLTTLSTVSYYRSVHKPFLFSVSTQKNHWIVVFCSVSFFTASFLIDLYSPQQGLQLSWMDNINNEQSVHSPVINHDRFELLPAHIPEDLRDIPKNELEPETITLSGYFQLDEPIHAWLLYTSHGNALWKVDGETVAEIYQDSNIRSLFSYTDIPAGIHHLTCEISGYDIVPSVSARVSIGTSNDLSVLNGPFTTSLDQGGLKALTLKNHIKWLLFALGLFALVPLLNAGLFIALSHLERYAGIVYAVIWLVTLFCFWEILSTFLQDPAYLQLEADETAFGLMSQQLLLGQSPPLFHYGQNYQGTFESIFLSALQIINPSPEIALKALPTMWFVLFIGITTVTFWRFGSKALALFSCVVFLFMGIHFHWLFHKAWFGYSFSLVCGSVMWYATLHALRYGLRPGIALLWGIFAGLSLYELPISIPFVITTFFLMLYNVWQVYYLDGFSWKKQIWNTLFHKSMMVLYVSSALFISPYLLSIAFEGKADSLSFLMKGRELSAPKESGEHPFFNRFLEECFPVLSGTRLPFDQQTNPDEIFFPYLPSILLVIGLLSFLLLCRKMKPLQLSGSAGASLSLDIQHTAVGHKDATHPTVLGFETTSGSLGGSPTLCSFQNDEGIIFNHPAAFTGIFIFAILTIWIGCYSPFGIWPWYFAALYWVVPVLLFPLFSLGLKQAPGLTIAVSILFMFTQTQSFSLLDERAFQPLSVSAAGLDLPTNFSEVVETLQEHDVKFVIADQGYDYSTGNAGRDWIGESLSYQSGMQIISFDSHSRRLPDQVQLLMRANRVGYLFHEDFFFQNPVSGDSNYTPITMDKLDHLFGPEFLNYTRFSYPPYILYIPKNTTDISNNNPFQFINTSEILPIPTKNQIHVETSYPYFVEPMMDHNLGIRSTSSRAYWSSGDQFPPEGVTISFTFDKAKKFDRIILFHGSKANDYPSNSEVIGFTADGKEIFLGKMTYYQEALASKMINTNTNEFLSVQIRAFPNDGGYWLTVYEAWIW